MRWCVVCGRELRTGRKYCWEHRNTRPEPKSSGGIGNALLRGYHQAQRSTRPYTSYGNSRSNINSRMKNDNESGENNNGMMETILLMSPFILFFVLIFGAKYFDTIVSLIKVSGFILILGLTFYFLYRFRSELKIFFQLMKPSKKIKIGLYQFLIIIAILVIITLVIDLFNFLF